ncbi:MAG: HAD family hydrolase [Candidatus Micrarchaeota archaeon]|nr:HAD family hydrolase [Candidatus Micrarchaeota archaeon]
MDGTYKTKPHWLPMKIAYERTEHKAGPTLYVGDTENDMEFARSVNKHYKQNICKSCFVENTYPRSVLGEGADFYFKNMQELYRSLKVNFY